MQANVRSKQSPRFGPLVLLLGVSPVVLAGCAGSEGTSPDDTPASISIVSGNNQTGEVDSPLDAGLVAVVKNAGGDGLSGRTVQWTVIAGGGTLGAPSSTTSASGQASNTYTLGSNVGTNTVRAAVQGTSLSTDFNATANAAPDLVPASIAVVSGNNQSAPVSTALAQSLVVVVKNAGGGVLSNVAVDWSVTAGGGSLGSAVSTTAGNGEASNTFTVDDTEGSSTIEAAVQSDATLTTQFTATATAVADAAVSVNDNQFDPNAVNVGLNSKVTWTWAGANQHNVTFVDGALSSSGTQSSGTHEVTFTQSGSFTYYCTIHGSPDGGMRGSVTVP